MIEHNTGKEVILDRNYDFKSLRFCIKTTEIKEFIVKYKVIDLLEFDESSLYSINIHNDNTKKISIRY